MNNINQTETDELVRKLNLKDQGSSYVMHAPDGYELPNTVDLNSLADVDGIAWIQAFYDLEDNMAKELPVIEAKLARDGCLWICWPKRSANKGSNLNDTVVRSIGLACGLVDVKIASINEVWSGLKFVYTKGDR